MKDTVELNAITAAQMRERRNAEQEKKRLQQEENEKKQREIIAEEKKREEEEQTKWFNEEVATRENTILNEINDWKSGKLNTLESLHYSVRYHPRDTLPERSFFEKLIPRLNLQGFVCKFVNQKFGGGSIFTISLHSSATNEDVPVVESDDSSTSSIEDDEEDFLQKKEEEKARAEMKKQEEEAEKKKQEEEKKKKEDSDDDGPTIIFVSMRKKEPSKALQNLLLKKKIGKFFTEIIDIVGEAATDHSDECKNDCTEILIHGLLFVESTLSKAIHLSFFQSLEKTVAEISVRNACLKEVMLNVLRLIQKDILPLCNQLQD